MQRRSTVLNYGVASVSATALTALQMSQHPKGAYIGALFLGGVKGGWCAAVNYMQSNRTVNPK